MPGLSGCSDLYLRLHHGSIAHRVGISTIWQQNQSHAPRLKRERDPEQVREVGGGFRLVIGQERWMSRVVALELVRLRH